MSLSHPYKPSSISPGPLLLLLAHGFWVLLLVAIVSNARAAEFLVLPVLGNQPDTGLQAGAAGFWMQSPDIDAPGVNFFLMGTQKKQVQAAVGAQLPGPMAHTTDYYFVDLYGSHFPSEFFGYGPDYREDSVSYDDTSYALKLGWSYPFNTRWRGAVAVLVAGAEVEFADPQSPLLDAVAWQTGGQLGGVELGLSRDTRDDRLWPTQGTLTDSVVTLATDKDQALMSWASQSAAAYYSLPAETVLAVGGQVQAASRNTPFMYMPTLDGMQWMRGVQNGQYRHHTSITGQAEARLPIGTRFAATAFVHSGQVAAQPDAWWDEPWKHGGGLGLRYSVSPQSRMNIRLDMGWVNGRAGMLLGFGEAF